MRVIEIDGQVLFGAADAAKALGYSNARDAILRHCKGVVKHDAPTNSGVQLISFITEGDLYRLIAHSKLPTAEAFEAWIFDEVLPTIRKHGAYMTPETLTAALQKPEMLVTLLQTLLDTQQSNQALHRENQALKPKADYFDAFIDPEDCTNIRVTAKELQVPERRFVKFLMDNGYLYRSPAGPLLPYAKKSNEGLFRVKDYIRDNFQSSQTLFTPKGKDHFRRIFCQEKEAMV